MLCISMLDVSESGTLSPLHAYRDHTLGRIYIEDGMYASVQRFLAPETMTASFGAYY